MPNKKYFVVSRIVEKISETNMITTPFCITTDEAIAKDFCEKNPQFTYWEEIINNG